MIRVQFPLVTVIRKGGRIGHDGLVQLPIIKRGVVSFMNMTRLSWTMRMKYARACHDAVHLILRFQTKPKLPVHVKILRLANQRKMDYSNVVVGCKYLQDAVAKWLNVDDGDDTVATWEFGQDLSGPQGSVRIEITEKEAETRRITSCSEENSRKEGDIHGERQDG